MIATESPEVLVAIIGAAVSVVTFAIGSLVSNVKDQRARRRDTYGQALRAVAAYKEFPYVVRRRRSGSEQIEADERARISEDLRKVQEELSYFTGWIGTESPRVANAYRELVHKTRVVAGSAIREAWEEPGVTSDAGMNMPSLGLNEIGPCELSFQDAASDNLVFFPKRWWRRVTRWNRARRAPSAISGSEPPTPDR